MKQSGREPYTFRSAFQQKDGGRASIRKGEGTAGGGLYSGLCVHTSAFHKEGQAASQRSTDSIINLEGILESSIKKCWRIS